MDPVHCRLFSLAERPPWVSRQVEERQTARLGRTVRLACPVEGDPPPLILWVKDGRNVHPGWSRYRVLKQSLKIKEVELGDAGVYVCRVTNGFGSIALNYTLIIIGRAKERLTSSLSPVSHSQHPGPNGRSISPTTTAAQGLVSCTPITGYTPIPSCSLPLAVTMAIALVVP
ncbi:unnamed protein product [Coregonus sp. 'balchen']|nr:unnamed protein product [Coregonus sp. 'balchen']